MTGRGSHQRMRGVALLTVLVVVVIATVLGVSLATQQNINVHRSRNLIELAQVRQYVAGGEELARQMLHEDWQEAPNKDHLLENWASPELLFEFEDGAVELQIEDLQGRFNVNSLAAPGQEGLLAYTRFRHLLDRLTIDPMFADRIADWIDADQNVRTLGAEDYAYLGLDRPYRSAGQVITDTSELRAVLEMDEETYQRLAEFVTAIPDVRAPINVNTASATVLSTLAPNVPPGQIDNALTLREEQEGFETVAAFFTAIGTPPQTNAAGLGVQSSFFKVTIRARYLERFGYLEAIVHRDVTDGSMRVVHRNLARPLRPISTEVEDSV